MADSTAARGDRTEGSGSTWYLLGMWILLGLSLFDLGTAVHEASTGETYGASTGPLGLSPAETGLLVATAVVAVLWIAGVRPSLWDCWTYLIAEMVLSQVVLLAAFGFDISPGSWATVGRHALSILLAAALVFSDPGRALTRLVWKRVRRLTAPEYRGQ